MPTFRRSSMVSLTAPPRLTLLPDRVRVDLDGQPPALADVTPAAVTELSLDPGSLVWLTVKAADLEVYPSDGRQAP